MSKQSQKRPNWGLSHGELVWRQFTKSWLNVACLVFVAFLLLLAVFAPFLASDRPFIIRIDGRWHFPLFKNLQLDATDYKVLVALGKATNAIFPPVPYGYDRTDLKLCRQPPSRQHWLGTDDVGADVLCRLIHGSRISLSVGFVAVGISTIIGIIVGAILGYFGGKIDFIGMRIVEAVMAIPVFFLIITMMAFFPRSILNTMIIIGVTGWTGSARFIRADFLKLRQQNFVQAAISLALPLRSILFRHMLPNALAPVLVNATFGISSAIFIEAALSFLGFGVAPPTPSWGQMLSLGVSTSGRFLWWLALFPGLAIFLTVMAYNLAGEGLRDAIDPRFSSLVTRAPSLVRGRTKEGGRWM
jgi:peptide/nickel transport system permease protein